MRSRFRSISHRKHFVPTLVTILSTSWMSFGVPDEPDTTILVLPLLRACNDPKWQTVGEILSFIKQNFEVIRPSHPLAWTWLMSYRAFNICTSCM